MSLIDAEHRGFATVLRALLRHLGPIREGEMAPNYDLFATILTYADTFMDRFHHPKEDEHLFRAVRSRTREADGVLLELQHDHASGPARLRELHEALRSAKGGLAGDVEAFARGIERYVGEQEAHMRTENAVVIPLACKVLTEADWVMVDQAFRGHTDPFFGAGPQGRSGSLFTTLHGFAPLQDPPRGILPSA